MTVIMLSLLLKIIIMFLFLYLVWRNLKDDYDEMKIVEFSWLCVLFFFFGGRMFYGFLNWGVWNESILDWFSFIKNPGFSYIGSYFFVLLGVFVFCWRVGWKVWNVLEDITPTVIFCFFLFLLVNCIFGFNKEEFYYLLILLLTFMLTLFWGSKYRSFYWYKSGKKGFLFLFSNMLTSLLFLFLVILGLFPSKLLILGLVFFLISLLGLFILGDVAGSLLVLKKKEDGK
ncbi:hypothetical protein KKC08_05695 [Patescibacteria group bacterium]|nr:hypothetical protein [Patescibacteria group bacterium]MCG2701519.1 hypothetical protein [Candidatus Parcubacteria bacterium]MBU4265278.1 hypothetical protein [Patescibacteria group bacterium]MBU4389963.1 hypothetical protein [Patescibacteria group bacterium]MBU4397627.1 hypothetical protein [Patescibacteria group bacterium]